ncbi:MAG: PIG-L family deacetylase [Acidobacteria bacterium]|nr:PIG-L family deacetylase [Acidobacteriota bacterium]
MTRAILVAALACSILSAAGPLPLGKVPPGKVFFVVLPHHDDHTWEYGFGGLMVKFADAGYTGYYVRVSNDEKDGGLGWAENDIVNHRETVEAVRQLGMKDVISLNWRNDHSDSVPHNEMRAQLILLIRKYRPDAILAYNPWGHYDRNPDHRKAARAVAEAAWAAGDRRFEPEHFKLGLEPHRVRYRYYSQRSDYGMGYTPNIAFELNESQMERKAKAYWMNRNVRLQPSLARSVRARLAQEKLRIPELDGLSDEEATKRLQEWSMYWISAKRGKENGVKYAEVFYFIDDGGDLGELKEPVPAGQMPPDAVLTPRAAGPVLVVTAHPEDYVLAAGGTMARLIGQGAEARVIQITGEASLEAARILGVKEVIPLGYRFGELGAVSPTELRDRLMFYIRHYQPQALFIPNPYTHYDDRLDHYYAGSAAEEARWAAAFPNFQPSFALAGLASHRTPELYYYGLPVDPRRRESEAPAPFVPQPKVVDIAAAFDRKLRAAQALKLAERRLVETRLRGWARSAAGGAGLSLAEEFYYTR